MPFAIVDLSAAFTQAKLQVISDIWYYAILIEMARLHICNTFFEKELERAARRNLGPLGPSQASYLTGSGKELATPYRSGESPSFEEGVLQSKSRRTLLEWLRSHPIAMQLQFLPLLYAGPEDRILVSDLPDNPDPRLCLIDQPPKGLAIEHWGPSLAINVWAQTHGIDYEIPDWEQVRQINSKVFSFIHSPKLPGAELLQTSEEITAWLQKTPGPKVLKTPFGTAGSGHRINPNVKQLYIGPMIGEPWVERMLDFSTQWKDGKLLGVTLFENEPNGTYRGTFAGTVEPWALEQHLAAAEPLIPKQGHVGVDAFIYLWDGNKRVHPVVEINARKTMSWVALQLPEKRLSYTRSETGLLPSRLGKIQFSRNVNVI